MGPGGGGGRVYREGDNRGFGGGFFNNLYTEKACSLHCFLEN